MRVKSEKYGIIHGVAFCQNCDWDSGIKTNEKDRMKKLRNRVYNHVKRTGHKVTLETGNSTDYFI